MMIRLGKISLFLTGFAVIVACYFIRQYNYISNSVTVTGTYLTDSTVVFEAGGKMMLLVPEEGAIDYSGGNARSQLLLIPDELERKVPVIYHKDDPTDAKLRTFFGLWFDKIAYFLIPLFIWASFSLSYLEKGEYIMLDLRRLKAEKNSKKKPHDKDLDGWNQQMKLE